MTADKVQLSSLSTRQKLTAGVFVLIVIFLAWQIKGLLSSGGSSAPTPAPKPITTVTSTGQLGSPVSRAPTTAHAPSANPQQNIPEAATQVPGQSAMTQREMELIKLQQETEAKYIAALNELQLLKVSQSIAETNKAIAAAKLDTVTAQKGVVDLLSGSTPTAASYARALGGTSPQQPMQAAAPQSAAIQSADVGYSVISVTQLQNRWNAVLGYQGNLYSVSIGDHLPPDSAKVVAIDKSGVTVEKNGQKRKLSLVPII